MPSSLNGTGVTFNDGTTLQSGNIPTANLGSGTASSSTFLRGDRTWQTISATPTTAQVLTATAGASVGAVGTYCTTRSMNVTVSNGATTAGSNLIGRDGYENPLSSPYSGTWRRMGGGNSPSTGTYPCLWLRIS